MEPLDAAQNKKSKFFKGRIERIEDLPTVWERPDVYTVTSRDGKKAYQCRGFVNCSMVFTRAEHLARHIRKHTGERPYRCSCRQYFSRLDNLRQHWGSAHPNLELKYEITKSGARSGITLPQYQLTPCPDEEEYLGSIGIDPKYRARFAKNGSPRHSSTRPGSLQRSAITGHHMKRARPSNERIRYRPVDSKSASEDSASSSSSLQVADSCRSSKTPPWPCDGKQQQPPPHQQQQNADAQKVMQWCQIQTQRNHAAEWLVLHTEPRAGCMAGPKTGWAARGPNCKPRLHPEAGSQANMLPPLSYDVDSANYRLSQLADISIALTKPPPTTGLSPAPPLPYTVRTENENGQGKKESVAATNTPAGTLCKAERLSISNLVA